MKQVLIKHGQAFLERVPAPGIEAGSILVQVNYSCISIGTELSGLKASGSPLWKRALDQPQKVQNVLNMALTQGISRTHHQIKGKLRVGQPTGYSAAGTVLEVGAGITDIRPGDRVACAGAQYAYHAEIIRVPRNLAVLVPNEVEQEVASTVTLGAIALQGIRRANPTLGETFVVIGLGILGQITAQLLRANGCRVIGVDLDRRRIEQAQELGMHDGVYSECGDPISHISRLTDGIGSDGVIITAATPSHEVVSNAFQMCRKKGRVVLVGDVGLHLKRDDFYKKEIDFFISTSYGPGRYDSNYEDRGMDYPLPYVRWTENRNMQEYLRLIADKKLSISPLITAHFPVEKVSDAFGSLKSGTEKPLIALLTYSAEQGTAASRTIQVNTSPRAKQGGRIGFAIVGAGSFAKEMHLPNLQALAASSHIRAIMSRTGHNALATAELYNANYATTDYDQILTDSAVDAIIIATRHNLHATMALQALRAGKHVLLEKPLALTQADLDEIVNYFLTNPSEPKPILLTGFNRRFSPLAQRMKGLLQHRTNPMIINYRMNAGYIPLDHWVHTEEGGGRNLGEACHIYDLFTYLTGSKAVDIKVQSLTPRTNYYSNRDNFIATIKFEDGSIASLTYTALGAKPYPKEQMEIFVDGKVLCLDDYKSLHVYGSGGNDVELKVADKGQKEELSAFVKAIKSTADWPIPLWEQVQATEIALRVDQILESTPSCI